MYFIFGKWSTEQNDIYYFEHKLPVVGGEGGGGHSIMFYMEGSASMSNLLPFYIYHFWQKRRIPSNDE